MGLVGAGFPAWKRLDRESRPRWSRGRPQPVPMQAGRGEIRAMTEGEFHMIFDTWPTCLYPDGGRANERDCSPSTRRRYGLARGCRMWEVARSTVYLTQARQTAPPRPAQKRGPKPRWSDEVEKTMV